MSEDLKPVRCGCGGEAVVGYTESCLCYVECQKCLTETRFFRTEAEAITSWNKAMGTNARTLMQAFTYDATCAICDKKKKERKTGEWLPHPTEREWDVCSVCGTGCKRREYEIQYGQERETEYNYPFCPHCGAKLD